MKPRVFGRRKTLVDDTGGAAIVEFTIAIMPIFLIFFGMVQWSINAYVHLIVKHAAMIAARCEAVVNPQMPDAGAATDCTKSAMTALFQDVPPVSDGDVQVQANNAGQYEQKLDSVTITLDLKCGVPLGNVIACTGNKQHFSETASFPNQGSAYQKFWVTSGSGS
jgi:Flp pilus assembly protein TadG